MIVQHLPDFKMQVFFCAHLKNVTTEMDFQKKYDQALDLVFQAGNELVLPCSGKKLVIGAPKAVVKNPNDPYYVRNGRYSRDVVDVYRVEFPDGHSEIRFHESEIRVQKVLASSGHDHAVLTSTLIPYEKFSTQAALYLLKEYYNSGETPEEFCNGVLGIDLTVTQLQRLIDWLNVTFPLLGIDVTPEKDNDQSRRDAYCNAIDKVMNNMRYYQDLCVRLTKRSFFQTRFPVFSPYLSGIPFNPSFTHAA